MRTETKIIIILIIAIICQGVVILRTYSAISKFNKIDKMLDSMLEESKQRSKDLDEEIRNMNFKSQDTIRSII